MEEFHAVPPGHPKWIWNHPTAAAAKFAEKHPKFLLEQFNWPFNESELSENITDWPTEWLQRK
ncbi:hypothetical protein [Microcoleus sp. FACHB-68]|uniref:hypothetical protein n=1 Tax=Microcoleus sp. FACHB-68 TaxID=2692826 RepID=UPI0016841DF3|nr:hypothetical protein [Microcoleus sp. FACHB-68]